MCGCTMRLQALPVLLWVLPGGASQFCSASGAPFATYFPQGFQRVADNLPDISLDNPAARERFDAAIKAARAGGRLFGDL